MKVTESQRRALAFLATVEYATPADIGYAVTPGRVPPLQPQGAGRIGGAMGSRLVRMGLANNASRQRGGFSAYAINRAGRAALREDV